VTCPCLDDRTWIVGARVGHETVFVGDLSGKRVLSFTYQTGQEGRLEEDDIPAQRHFEARQRRSPKEIDIASALVAAEIGKMGNNESPPRRLKPRIVSSGLVPGDAVLLV
jgi:hypothetical protein